MGNVGKGKITPRQRDFAEFFIQRECSKGEEDVMWAYRKAGFKGKKGKSGCVSAYRILELPQVQEYINKRINEVRELTNVTIKEVIEKYAAIMRFDFRKLYKADGVTMKGPHELDSETAKAILEMHVVEEIPDLKDVDADGNPKKIVRTKKVKSMNPKDAADSLAKLFTGGFGNTLKVDMSGEVKHEHNVKGGVLLIPKPPNMEDWMNMVDDIRKFKTVKRKEIGYDKMIETGKLIQEDEE